MIEAMYATDGILYLKECDTVEGALTFLEAGSDEGSCVAIAVLVDGRCELADPYLHPEQPPTRREATDAEQLYRRARGGDRDLRDLRAR